MTSAVEWIVPAAAAAATSLVYSVVIRKAGPHSFIWRHGTHATGTFLTDATVDAVLAEAAQLPAQRRGWRLKSIDPDAGSVILRTGSTAKTWGRQIEIVASARDRGTIVWATSRSPQLVDWRQNARTVEAVATALNLTDIENRGSD